MPDALKMILRLIAFRGVVALLGLVAVACGLIGWAHKPRTAPDASPHTLIASACDEITRQHASSDDLRGSCEFATPAHDPEATGVLRPDSRPLIVAPAESPARPRAASRTLAARRANAPRPPARAVRSAPRPAGLIELRL